VIPVLDSKQMRRADRETIRRGVPSTTLMENAASALVAEVRRELSGWRRVVVVCGPGNNGGDGLAAARLLAARGVVPVVFTLRDPARYSGDAAWNAGRAREAGLELTALDSSGAWRQLRRSLSDCDGVLDALFGTGLTRALDADAARAVGALNRSARPVLAADLPSGLSADSGALLGPCVRAARTVAFGAPKRCHAFAPARDLCGAIRIADIGIPRRVLEAARSRFEMTEAADVAGLLPPRAGDSHKGDFGRLAVVAGSRGKAGAAVLCAHGALRAGAGLVTVFCAESIEPVVVTALPEAMTHPLAETDGALAAEAEEPLISSLAGFDAAIVGPGLTTSPGAAAVVRALVGSRLPLVCDADALNAFAGHPAVWSHRRAPTVLTPHPGEAARLLSSTTSAVQADRFRAATALARKSRAVVVLKGEGSLIAAPDGRAAVNPTGSPLMATAGSGDVLAGALGAFLAAGLAARDAALAAVYLHGSAGERLARDLGDAGLLAGELADALPRARVALHPSGVDRRRAGAGRRESDWKRKP
jgi:NAD(P)H-hydrate epimerase